MAITRTQAEQAVDFRKLADLQKWEADIDASLAHGRRRISVSSENQEDINYMIKKYTEIGWKVSFINERWRPYLVFD